jgi:hypothetical protein
VLLQSFGCSMRSIDEKGNTLLHCIQATESNRDDLVIFLLKNGVDPLALNHERRMASCLERIDSIRLPTRCESLRESIKHGVLRQALVES